MGAIQDGGGIAKVEFLVKHSVMGLVELLGTMQRAKDPATGRILDLNNDVIPLRLRGCDWMHLDQHPFKAYWTNALFVMALAICCEVILIVFDALGMQFVGKYTKLVSWLIILLQFVIDAALVLCIVCRTIFGMASKSRLWLSFFWFQFFAVVGVLLYMR